jgi:hypothetical protein
VESGLSLDAMINRLADRVAERLGAKVLSASNANGIRPRLLTVEQAALYLSRSTHSMRHLIRSKKVPVVRLDDRLFLDVRDLDRAIEEAKQLAV